MAMDMLERIAGSRLPLVLRSAEDIDAVRILRAAGLVIAFVPAPGDTSWLAGPERAAQVLALTQKGREELHPISYPAHTGHRRSEGGAPARRLRSVVERARRLLH